MQLFLDHFRRENSNFKGIFHFEFLEKWIFLGFKAELG